MKKLITLLLIATLLSCSKSSTELRTAENDCWLCKWGQDVDGTVRPDFTVCDSETNPSMGPTPLFRDERGNNLGGSCEIK
jgi:hypothetical protein